MFDQYEGSSSRMSAWAYGGESTEQAEAPALAGKKDSMARAVRLIGAETLSSVAQYSYAASVEPGARLIFLAGACPLDAQGRTVGVDDVAQQASCAVVNMVAALEAAGAELADVVFTRVLVASARQEDLVAVWNVVRDAFDGHPVPSTLLGVTVLGYPDQLVEIEAVAAVLE